MNAKVDLPESFAGQICPTAGCGQPAQDFVPYCPECMQTDLHMYYSSLAPLIESPELENLTEHLEDLTQPVRQQTMAEKYPAYYKSVLGMTEVDVYAVHQLFNVEDPSGAIHHASKKLLLSGQRTGDKPKAKDIKEARDTLTRWLQLNGAE